MARVRYVQPRQKDRLKGYILSYSYLPNSRGGSNKRGGWQNCQYEINGQGENVSNKRGGWKSLRA